MDIKEESSTLEEQAKIQVKKNRIQKKFDIINSLRQANSLTKFNSIHDFISYVEIKEYQYFQFIKYCNLKFFKNKIKDLSDEDLITYFVFNIDDQGSEVNNIKGREIIHKELFTRKLKIRT